MNRLTLFVFLLMLAAALGCSVSQMEAPDGAAVRIGGKATYSVDMAVTDAERQQGLSGREFMAQDAGMLFVFEGEQPRQFWMKDMRFPLDIIWIDGQCRLVGVSADVPILRPTRMTPIYPGRRRTCPLGTFWN